MAIKRLHYYDQQFLVEGDFTSEQKYHLDMRRRLSRVLHTFGIAEGLDVLRTAARQVTVKAGTAIDNTGREIVLEADQVVDLSNLTTFPANSTVFVTIAYQEGQSDPSTATGAPGNTRFTEAPLVLASTTVPVTDGTVIRLARIVKDNNGDIPGNLNDPQDGGVRQASSAKIASGAVAETNLAPALASKINTPTGVISVDGVTNPGGNVDLIAANAIQLTPNNVAKTITIGETHSVRTDNPHNTTAAQIGALLAASYDLRLRQLATVTFTQGDATGAVRAVALPFQVRLVLAIGNVSANLGARAFGGLTIGLFDSLSGQRCNGFALTRVSDTDWFSRGAAPTGGIAGALIFDSGNAQAENLTLTLTSPSPTGFSVTLTRGVLSAALANFTLTANLFCMGT